MLISGVSLFSISIIAALISFYESENKAAFRLLLVGFLLPVPFVFSGVTNYAFNQELSIVLISLMSLVLILLVLPFGKRKYTQPKPLTRIDERDTMFSRNELKPGTTNFEDYYKRNPDKKEIDDAWRKEAGLLKEGSSHYHPVYFASADASFETIKALSNKVDGEVNSLKTKTEINSISSYVKNWSVKLGAIDAGITELQEYHYYSHGGRAERYNLDYHKKHQYAVAFTVEMDKAMVDAAPRETIVMESAQQYLESGRIALQLASFIRNLGYEARAHIDGNYEVVCPLVARDAGLGEIGRMGLLMTPKLGPRVRIGVVTTNLPLKADKPLNDYSMIDFCTLCKKCADACPGKAISFDEREEVEGTLRWKINQEACFTVWCKLGTDCGRCVSVCPYSHPDNLMHNVIRAGIKNSSIFRVSALKLDDFIYGKKPAVAESPCWMKFE